MKHLKIPYYLIVHIIFSLFFLTSCAVFDYSGRNNDSDDEAAYKTTGGSDSEDSITQSRLPSIDYNIDNPIELIRTGPKQADRINNEAKAFFPPKKYEMQLFAANAYLNEGNVKAAQAILNSFAPSQLPLKLNLRRKVLQAALDLERNRVTISRNNILELSEFNNEDPVFNNWLLITMIAILKKSKNTKKLIGILTNYSESNSHVDKAYLNNLIWQQVSQQDLAMLKKSRLRTKDSKYLAWIELAIIYKNRATHSTQRLSSDLSMWLRSYESHPAKQIHEQISSKIENLALSPTSAADVAVLLPISSVYKDIANSIKDGIFTASKNSNIKVRVYDTGNLIDDTSYYYKLAINEGAQVIIGPLGTNAINNLLKNTQISKPTLLLGSMKTIEDKATLNNKSYLFSLNPEHQTKQLATQAFSRGNTQAVVIYPSTPRGRRINNAFLNQWTNLGGTVNYSIAHEKEIYEVGGVLDGILSPGSIKPDMIYIASNPQQARLLAQRISTKLPNIAIYATSSIYSGISDPSRDFVLDGVIFSDMPWMIEDYTDIQYKKQRLASKEYLQNSPLSRYYAFGIDSLSLAMQFLNKNNAQKLDGMSGNIVLQGREFTINQRLVQFVQGTPRALD